MKFNLENILWDKHLTQRKLCKITGLSAVYINAIYKNKTTRIELDKLKKICDALNITPNDLIVEEQDSMREKLKGLQKEYLDVYDEICLEKANGDLSKLCNLREQFDETFDKFFDSKEIRKKYDKDFQMSNNEIEEMLNDEELKSLIEFYENYISELREELTSLQEN